MINIESIATVLGIILSLCAICGLFFKFFKKIDKIDKIDIILSEMEEIKGLVTTVSNMQKDLEEYKQEEEESKTLLGDLKSNLHDVSVKLDSVTEESRFNTSMNKVNTDVLEALADHAIRTQNANGKVHRSLEMLAKLKFDNPKFS